MNNVQPAGDKQKVTYNDFAGDQACFSCHKDIATSHIHTAHYLTSSPSDTLIRGSFDSSVNVFEYPNGTYVAMEKRDSGYYQVGYSQGIEKIAHRFDIVIGSATKGQTYLYWKNDHLFQLPVTYFTLANQWCNSPGFPERAVFNRPITSRCLECHATFATVTSAPGVEPETYDHNKIVYGVSCERCHGSAVKHVEYHTQHSSDKTGKYIINPKYLSRQQNLDLCALCHGGRLQKTTASFQFTVGDKLSDYFRWDTTVTNAADIDVHGNQLGLLKFSKCFTKSTTLTCNSCHNSHVNEKKMLNLYSEKCMTCHNTVNGTFCSIKQGLVADIKNNCIDCHMPKQASKAVAVFLPGQSSLTSSLIRTHLIKVYPEETAKYLSQQSKHNDK